MSPNGPNTMFISESQRTNIFGSHILYEFLANPVWSLTWGILLLWVTYWLELFDYSCLPESVFLIYLHYHIADWLLILLADAHFMLFGCRLTSNFLLQSTYSLSRTCNVYKRGYGLDVCGLKMGCGFHSQSFQKSHWFSPLSTRYIGRYSSLHNIQRSYCTAAIERKSKNMLFYLVALVLTMVGCSYAAVPLYRRFCQATGYGGTVQRREVFFFSFCYRVRFLMSLLFNWERISFM